MSIEILEAKAELKDLVDTFSNLADMKDAPPHHVPDLRQA